MLFRAIWATRRREVTPIWQQGITHHRERRGRVAEANLQMRLFSEKLDRCSGRVICLSSQKHVPTLGAESRAYKPRANCAQSVLMAMAAVGPSRRFAAAHGLTAVGV